MFASLHATVSFSRPGSFGVTQCVDDHQQSGSDCLSYWMPEKSPYRFPRTGISGMEELMPAKRARSAAEMPLQR